MMIAQLIEIMCQTKYLWQAETAYDQGWKFTNPKFKHTMLNKYTVLYIDRRMWVIPRKTYHHFAIVEFDKIK